MATTAQIIDQVIRRLSELSTVNPVHWPRQDILEYFIEAVNELNLIAGEIQRSEPINSSLSLNVYTLQSTAIAPLSVRVNGKYVIKQFVDDLDNEMAWESSSAVRRDITNWCALGGNKILIAPRPTINPTIITVEELTEHPVITDGPMTLSIRPEYEPAIEDYMVHRAMFREGGPEFNQLESFYARFLDAVQQLSGKNIIRGYPSWGVSPEAKSSESTLQTNVNPGGRV